MREPREFRKVVEVPPQKKKQKKERNGMLPIVGFGLLIIVALIVGTVMMHVVPHYSQDLYNDQVLMCVQRKGWGFTETKNICFKITQIH